MRYIDKSITDRLRPGLSTTASGVAQQGTCGNYATAVVKTRGEKEEKGE